MGKRVGYSVLARYGEFIISSFISLDAALWSSEPSV